MEKPKRVQRTREHIVADLQKEAKKYKGLKPGSVAFRNVSKKLQSLDKELHKLIEK